MDKLITIADVQEMYRIGRATIDRWRKEGMPSQKVGRGVRFNEDEIKKWIKDNKQ